MYQLAIAFALGFVSFVATSLDNLLLLIGFLGNPAWTRRAVSQAYVAAIGIVVLVALLLSELARYGPFEGRGLVLLGFLPIGLGLYLGLQLVIPGMRSRRDRQKDALSRTMELRRGRAAVASVTLAASGDSLAAYTALFADTAHGLLLAAIAGILLGAVVWTAVAGELMRRDQVGQRIERLAPVLLPLVLIGLGLYILGDTPTDITPPAR
ncbi:MAG: cadmium resistance transporter [marine benthic group bacterium]|nr:cadmium resistance transporter [Gemmatimonadota bacterium]